MLASVALAARRLLVVTPKLALEHSVHALQLLLLAQLRAVIRLARTRDTPMLTGFAIGLGFRIESAARALQKQIAAFATRKL